MPITVRHGDNDLSQLAGLAALAGAANFQMPGMGGGGGGFRPIPIGPGASFAGFGNQKSAFESADKARRLRAEMAMQDKEIQAAADLEKTRNKAAAERVAEAGGLRKEMAQIEYDNEIASAKEQAKIDVSKTKTEFTNKQRAKQNEINNAMNELTEQYQAGKWTKSQYEAGQAKLNKMKLGLQPSEVLRSPGDVSPQEKTWTDPQTGALMSSNADGEPVKLADYEKTLKGRQEIAAQKVHEDKMDKMNTAINKVFEMTGKDDKPISSAERERLIRDIKEQYGISTGGGRETFGDAGAAPEFRQGGMQAGVAAGQQVAREMPEGSLLTAEGKPTKRAKQLVEMERAARPWHESEEVTGFLEERGLELTESDKSEKIEVGMSKAVLRGFMKEYGSVENVPEEYQAELMKVLEVLEQRYGG
jgi:hypothetical protein